MLRSLVPFLVMTACAWGEEKSAVAWTDELVATYQKLDGYVAVYRTEAKDKSADITLALDRTSGLFVIDLQGMKDGKPGQFRQWNTDDDEIYSSAGAERFVLKGIGAELRSLVELVEGLSVVPNEKKSFNFRCCPDATVSASSITPGVIITKEGEPPWKKLVEAATVKATDGDGVTFGTKSDGDITISRQHGLMIRQACGEGDGPVRVLELQKITMNPGRKSLESLSAGWEKAGAQPMPTGSVTARYRVAFFQATVLLIENGAGDLGKLHMLLEEQADVLRRFADTCVLNQPGSLAAKENWTKGLTAMRQEFKEKWPEADEKACEAQLSRKEIREAARDKMVALIMENEDRAREIVMRELFQARLKASNEVGESAKELLERAITRAYLEAIAERKIKEMWGEREGLD